MEDDKGFIWLGTRTGGLNRYDGYEFKNYYYDPSNPFGISGNEILTLFQDSKGYIWVGTRNSGLNRFDPGTERFETFYASTGDQTSVPHNTAKSIIEISEKIWIGTNLGLCIYNEEDNSFERINNTLDSNESFGQITSLVTGDHNNIYIGTKSGVYVIDAETKETLLHFSHDKNNPKTINDNDIQTLYFDKRKQLWVGTRNKGLSLLKTSFANKDFKRFIYNEERPNGIINNIVRTILEDKNGNIWIATKEGLEMLTPGEQITQEPRFSHFQHSENNSNSLSQNSVYSLIEDSKGNLWAGMWSAGVNFLYLGRSKFEHYKHQLNIESTLSDDNVSSFTNGKNGVWIGTEGGGLNLFDRENSNYKVYQTSENENSLVSNHVKALLEDDLSNLWIGTFKGLNYLDVSNERFNLFLEGLSIYSIIKPRQDELWVGTNKGLFVLDGNGKILKTYRETNDIKGITNEAIHTLFQDKNDRIWVGTKDGLNLYDRSQDNFYRFEYDPRDSAGISHYYVTSINEDELGNLWVGTLGGLNKLNQDNKTFTQYGRKSGFPDVAINNIVFDEEGNLWVTTNQGLSRIAANSLDRQQFEIRDYDLNDGIQDYEFIMNASYKNGKGEIFLGGVNGFNLFDPLDMVDNLEIPKIFITSLSLFNEKMEVGAEGSPLNRSISEMDLLKLKPGQSSITLEYVALNYKSSENNEYAYILEGFDKEWTYVGNVRQASYTNLPHGTYTFKVKGSNNDGVWNETGASIEIYIEPHWWQTMLFRILSIATVLLIAFLFFRSRIIKERRDRQFLEQKVTEATDQLKVKNEVLEQQQEKLRSAVIETNEVIDHALESGNFQGRIDAEKRTGEWKALAESINSLFASVSQPFSDINEVIDNLAKGDLTSRYQGEVKGDIKILTDNLNMAVTKLGSLLSEISSQSKVIGESTDEMLESSEEMSNNTSEISSSISQMSHGASEQQSQIDNSFSLLESILQSTNELINKANAINKSANSGAETSEKGMKHIHALDESMEKILSYSKETNTSIGQLSSESQEISQVIRIIKEIAAQTNLLALNAAIEAAQAGDSGRGFAVVAEEIRKLAENSKKSVSEIELLITSLQSNTNSTAKLIEGMGNEIKQGGEASKESLSAFQEISEQYEETRMKSAEIVDQVNDQISSVKNVVNISSGIVVISEETAAGSEEVAASATELASGMTSYAEKTRSVSTIVEELIQKVSNFKF